MKVGLLWFDDDPKSDLEAKVRRATQYYERKYGRRPDLCFVHPAALGGNGKVQQVNGVAVRPGHTVLPHHFWLGWEEKRERTTG